MIEATIFIGDTLEDLAAEIENNTWLISNPSIHNFEGLVEIFHSLIANRLEQVQKASKQGMIFYTWHDEQASQLRFCLISDFHSKLPFGAEIIPATLEEIIEEFLASPDNIPYSELSFETSASTEPIEEFKLKVFQKPLSL